MDIDLLMSTKLSARVIGCSECSDIWIFKCQWSKKGSLSTFIAICWLSMFSIPKPLHVMDQGFFGPVLMEASQPAYRAGALCRDLTSSLIPMQNLISVHMTRRAGPLSEIPLV